MNIMNTGIRDSGYIIILEKKDKPLDNIYNLSAGMKQLIKKTDLSVTYFTAQPTIKEYLTQTTINEGMADEYKVDIVRIPALEPAGAATTPATPVTTRDGTTKVETIGYAIKFLCDYWFPKSIDKKLDILAKALHSNGYIKNESKFEALMYAVEFLTVYLAAQSNPAVLEQLKKQ